MNSFWLFIMAVVTLLLVFVIIPNATRTPHVLDARNLRVSNVVTQESIESIESKRMLDAHYKSAREVVPVDEPLKQIGECPYSKAQSSDLPIPNIPMNVIVNSQYMRLSNECDIRAHQ